MSQEKLERSAGFLPHPESWRIFEMRLGPQPVARPLHKMST